MSRYSAWEKRCQNATPYAHEAVYDSKPGFCPEYIPKEDK